MGLAAAHQVVGPADEADTLNPGFNDSIFQPGHFFGQEMLQGDMRITDSHQGMQIGAAQVAVDEDNLLAQAGQGDPQS